MVVEVGIDYNRHPCSKTLGPSIHTSPVQEKARQHLNLLRILFSYLLLLDLFYFTNFNLSCMNYFQISIECNNTQFSESSLHAWKHINRKHCKVSLPSSLPTLAHFQNSSISPLHPSCCYRETNIILKLLSFSQFPFLVLNACPL